MTDVLVIVLVALVLVGAGLRARAWWTRRSAVARIEPAQIVRHASNVTMRILVQGTRVLPGMSTRNANRTRGDLVLTRDRFLLATNRGVLADLKTDGTRGFTSARCTGPGRLVIEGDVPGPDGVGGLYRVEIPLPDADAWAEALRPFVRARRAD